MGAWGVISSAVMMFVSTNIDDALVLIVYFANAAEGRGGLRAQDVWFGQLLGFSIIMAVSLFGVIGSQLQPRYSGLLGVVPLWMGLKRMREWWKTVNDTLKEGESSHHQQNSVPPLTVRNANLQPQGKGDHDSGVDCAIESRSDQLQTFFATTKATPGSKGGDQAMTSTSNVIDIEEELSWTRIVLRVLGSDRGVLISYG